MSTGIAHFFDSNRLISSTGGVDGATVYFYYTGTSNLAPIYSDINLTSAMSNPITISVGATVPEIFLDPSIVYRRRTVFTSDGSIWDEDPIFSVSSVTDVAVSASKAAVAANIATIQSGYNPPSPKADLFIHFGQSLTVARSPLITSAAAVVPKLYTFNGGAEYAYFDDPASGSITSWPAHPGNFVSLENFVPYTSANKESHAAGFGYQSYVKGDADISFYFSPGYGGASARLLRPGSTYWCGFALGIIQAVKLIRNAGYEPVPHIIWDHGHANADQYTDGNLTGETETSSADYQTACNKIFSEIRRMVSAALGTTWTGPIWVAPLLTAGTTGSVYTLTGRKNIVAAQLALQSSGVRLLPAWSQWVSTANCESDGVHPAGQGMRYRGELFGAYILKGLLRPPKMVSKGLSGSVINVTFDQPVAISTRVLDGTSLPGMKGFEVYDNTGTAKTITSVAPHATNNKRIVITTSDTTNLTGSWYVRAGLQQTTTGNGTEMFPRTYIKGLVDVGTTEDGTVIENIQIPQEI